jgi:endonuclease III
MEFINEYKKTRSGFAHITKLFNEGVLLVEVKCNYLNRTWESYTFESSMKQAVHVAIENEISAKKTEKGIKRLTKKLKETIETESNLIQQLKDKLKTL